MANINDILMGLLNPNNAMNKATAQASEKMKPKIEEGAEVLRALLSTDLSELASVFQGKGQNLSTDKTNAGLAKAGGVEGAKGIVKAQTAQQVIEQATIDKAKKKIDKGADEATEGLSPEQLADIVAKGNANDEPGLGNKPLQQGQNVLQDLLGRVAKGLSQDYRAKEAGIEQMQAQTDVIPKKFALEEKQINNSIALAASQEERLRAVQEKDLFNAKREVYKLAQDATSENMWTKSKDVDAIEKNYIKMGEAIKKMRIAKEKIDVTKLDSKVQGKIDKVSDLVKVINSQGVVGSVSKAELPQALKEGYRKI